MRYNANKGVITLLKAKKRESQMRNNAFKGEKNAKVKCEITQIKAKKRESQMRNNALKGEITLLKAK